MSFGPASQRFIILWILCGIILAIAMLQPAHRTQEARVLLTAREMHDKPLGKAWLVPVCNGEIRLAKPPLAYWLSAMSLRIFGINPIAGRLPMVMAGWLSIAVAFALGRLLFGSRAGLFAGGALLATILTVRYGTLAETDVLAMFFVVAAIGALCRSVMIGEGRSDVSQGSLVVRRPHAGWLHLAAVFIALTILAKGAPALFILMFAIVLAIIARDARVLTRFITSGAILTLALIALPWFWYVRTLPEAGPALQLEYDRLAGRGGHNESLWYYLIELPRSLAPGTALLLLALVAAATHWRIDARLRLLLAWTASVFIALSITPQKQPHYLMPVLPALAAVGGWMMDRALSGVDPPLGRALKFVLAGMLIAGGAAGLALPIAGRVARGWIAAPDLILGICVIAAVAVIAISWRRRDPAPATTWTLLASSLLVALVTAWWVPSLKPHIRSDKQIALDLLARFPSRPFAYLNQEDLPLAFFLGRDVRTVADNWPSGQYPPDLVLIDDLRPAVAPPPGFEQRITYPTRNGEVRVYTKPPSDSASTHPG